MERYLTSLYLSLLTYKAGSSNSSYFRVRDHLEEGLTERKCSSASLLLLFQFSSVASDSLQPHRLQQARPPYPSPTPGAYSSSCPSTRWCHPNISSCLPLFLLPSIFPSIRVLSNESALCIRWPKYWRFTFNISPSNEHPGLIFFRVDWLDLLAAQGILKSLLQHHSSKASIFSDQLSL